MNQDTFLNSIKIASKVLSLFEINLKKKKMCSLIIMHDPEI